MHACNIRWRDNENNAVELPTELVTIKHGCIAGDTWLALFFLLSITIITIQQACCIYLQIQLGMRVCMYNYKMGFQAPA